MNDRSALEWLREAREFALEAQKFAGGLSQGAFDNDSRTRFAVCFCLVVVGEAMNRVPKDVQALAPEIRWMSITGLRNRLIHGYWLINSTILLRIAQTDTSDLATSLERLIKKIG